MLILNVDQKLAPETLILFFRLLRFYKSFIILSALIGGLSLSILQFNEFHPTISSPMRAAEGFLVSSASSSVIAGMLATMLPFRFQGQEAATRKDYLLAWSPLVLLDWSIVAFLVGLLLWYGEKSNGWRIALVGSQTALMLVFVCGVAVWMWSSIRRRKELGKEEMLSPLKSGDNRATDMKN